MKNSFKPDGYNSLSPYLVVSGARKMMELLTTVFHATVLRRYDNEDGTVMHLEMKIDDSVVMIADSSDQYPPNKLLLHVYVRDVDSIFDKAIGAGCQPMERPVRREGDPDKRGSFMDFGGNIWAIGTQSDQ